MKNYNKKISKNVANTAFLMSIFILGRKLLGFIKESIIAYFFGTSYLVDAYVMAQNIPNIFLSGLLAAVSTSFLPLFAEKNEKKSAKSANDFINQILTLLGIVSLIVAIIGSFFSSQMVLFFASGFNSKQRTLTIFFLKIIFFAIFFTSINSLLVRCLEYKGVFIPQILTSYIEDFITIVFAIISAYIKDKLLILGPFLGYIVVFFILLKLCADNGIKSRPNFHITNSAKEILLLAFPVFLGGYVSQINVYVDKMLASGLPVGSVTSLHYAILVCSTFSGITVSIVHTIVFPKLNNLSAICNKEGFDSTLKEALSVIALIGVPLSVGIMCYSRDIVTLLWGRGSFKEDSIIAVSKALFWYAPYLAASAISYQVVQGFYANKDMKTPMYIGFLTALSNIILDLILVKKMAIEGLALATSLVGIIGLALRSIMLRKKFAFKQMKSVIIKIFALILITIISIVPIWFVLNRVSFFTNSIIIKLVLAVVCSAFIYWGFLNIFKIPEVVYINNLFINKNSIKKSKSFTL